LREEQNEGWIMRARFTIDQIASAALRIVDESGPGALSMRTLATALGTGPMTMYNYVADKEGLEELVVAAVVAGVEVPAPTDDWQHDVHAVATAMWRAVRAHPAAIPLVLTRRMASATGFAIAEALVGALGRAGLSDGDRLSAFHAVLGLVTGSAQAELAGPFTGGAAEAAAAIGAVAGAKFPHLAALSRVATRTSVEADFDGGLRMLLDGIAVRAAPSKKARRARAAPPV
jgi:AcrR family transcriptional regulator